MEKYIRKAAPACLGANIGVALVRQYSDGLALGNLLVNVAASFAVSLLVVAGGLWLWDKLRQK